MARSARIVFITHPPRGARAFARALVERRLVACVNLLPVRSVYRWRAALEEGREMLLIAKTTRARLGELERTLAREHPYDVPEFLALEPSRVEARYLAWLTAESRPARQKRARERAGKRSRRKVRGRR